MGVPYHSILAATALRINALVGVDQAELETTYIKSATQPLTVDDFQSSVFPMTAIRDANLHTEQKLAEAAGRSADRALRSRLRSESDPLASGDPLPSFDVNGLSIVGNYGAVWDETDPTIVYTRQPVAVIRRRLARTDLILPVYQFALDSGFIVHTGTNVIVECCVWDWLNQTAAYDANDDMLLPDAMAEAIICGGVALLVRDDEFMEQAGRYATYFAAELAAIPAATMEGQAV